jgi:drug/metabolite transporter (DMT)-like permease
LVPARPAAAAGSRLGAVALAAVGVGGTIALQYLSFATAPVVQANIVAYAWPLLVATWLAVSHFGRASLWSLSLALVGFGGVALMVGGGGGAGGGGSSWGLVAAAGSAACMAMYTLAAPRTAGREHDALTWATGLGAAVALGVTLASGLPTTAGPGLLAAVYTGLGPMAAGYLCWTRAMASESGRSLAPLAYATPLLSTVLLVATTGQRLEGAGLVGAGVTLAATVAVLARPRNL